MTDDDNNKMRSLIEDVEQVANTIADRQEEVTELGHRLRVRRLENHFSYDIARLLRGDR